MAIPSQQRTWILATAKSERQNKDLATCSPSGKTFLSQGAESAAIWRDTCEQEPGPKPTSRGIAGAWRCASFSGGFLGQARHGRPLCVSDAQHRGETRRSQPARIDV